MWEIKTFKTLAEQNEWIAKNGSKYQYDVIFVNNGYGLHVRKLRRVY